VYVNSFLLGQGVGELRRLDPDAGRIEPLTLPEAEALDCSRGSPWRDSRGRWQVAGRGWSRSGLRLNPTTRGYCLALYEFPGGVVRDRVETEHLPIGPLCWEPGTSARVLFAALDGALYWHEFEGSDPSGAGYRGGISRPQPLAWACPQPGPRGVFLTDPEWPPDARFGSRLFVSLLDLDRVRGPWWQLWWLRLDRARMAIVAAGPLLPPDPTTPSSEPLGDRFPTLLSGPGGALAVAYLASRPGVHLSQLRVAPLRIDPATGEPSAPERGPVLAGDCLQTAPALSADGRWLCCVVQPEGSGPKVLRLDLAEVHRRLLRGAMSSCSGAVSRPPPPLGPSPPSTSDYRSWTGASFSPTSTTTAGSTSESTASPVSRSPSPAPTTSAAPSTSARRPTVTAPTSSSTCGPGRTRSPRPSSPPAGENATNYNHGELPAATGAVHSGQTAGIDFWNNKNEQALIKALNGGVGTQLGDWLSATFSHIFGALSGSNDLAGQNNAYVASFFQSPRFVVHGQKLNAQLPAVPRLGRGAREPRLRGRPLGANTLGGSRTVFRGGFDAFQA
jgi:hypothetical protein